MKTHTRLLTAKLSSACAELRAEREELRVLSGEMDGFTFDPFSGEWARESEDEVGGGTPGRIRPRSRKLGRVVSRKGG